MGFPIVFHAKRNISFRKYLFVWGSYYNFSNIIHCHLLLLSGVIFQGELQYLILLKVVKVREAFIRLGRRVQNQFSEMTAKVLTVYCYTCMVIRCYSCLWWWETARTKSYYLSLQFILKEHLVRILEKGMPNFSGSTYFLGQKRAKFVKKKRVHIHHFLWCERK